MTPRLKFRSTDAERRLVRGVLWGVLAALIIGAVVTDYFGRSPP